jgi:phenylpropionate dioxygenase-like ring-hydroxylating dioxygenase large terminal subunit
MTWRPVCPVATLTEEIPFAVEVSGVAVCVVRIAGEFFAVHDECTHQAVPLSEGDVEDGMIECWRHGVTVRSPLRRRGQPARCGAGARLPDPGGRRAALCRRR